MGKLQHLYADTKPGPMQLIEGFLGAISDNVADQLKGAVGADVEAQRRATEAVQVALYNLAPKLEQAVQDAISGAIGEAGKSLRKELEKLAADVKERSITQQDMVKLQGDLVRALSNVRIPDYSEQLRRLEGAKVDLGPLLDKLDNLEVDLPVEDRPRQWTFDIKRDRNGLIQSIEAMAG